MIDWALKISLTAMSGLLGIVFLGAGMEGFQDGGDYFVAVTILILLSVLCFYVFYMLLTSGSRHKKQTEADLSRINLIIQKHKGELSLRRSQLIVPGAYGLVDDSKWVKEVDYFLNNVALPVNSESAAYTRIEIEKATSSYGNAKSDFSDSMSPLEYERLVADRLRGLGWDARTTVPTGDQGIDVIAEKDGQKLVVQCKLYSSPVGNKAVQEVIAGKTFEQADMADVVSNATFTPSAKQLASSAGVFLLHHDQLDTIAIA